MMDAGGDLFGTTCFDGTFGTTPVGGRLDPCTARLRRGV
jgi:hypothetical protein